MARFMSAEGRERKAALKTVSKLGRPIGLMIPQVSQNEHRRTEIGLELGVVEDMGARYPVKGYSQSPEQPRVYAKVSVLWAPCWP